jgi:hypothetical protein
MAGDPFQPGPLQDAVHHLFNGNLALSQLILKEQVSAHPQDPLVYSLSAAAPFYTFIGNQFRSKHSNSIQSMITGDKIAMPEAMRQDLARQLQHARHLAAKSEDQNSVLALCVAEGVHRDLLALVFRHWNKSLEHARLANVHAQKLLSLNPAAYDAYFVIGFSEQMLAQIPSVFKPFTKIPGIVGHTGRAIQFLEATAASGWFFRHFARQMLVTLYKGERRPQDALRILSGLVADFPGNSGFRKEWTSLQNGL